jgi:hypothetical protein
MLYLFLDRGVSNSLDNNLLFLLSLGILISKRNWTLFFMELKSQDQKNQEYMRSIRKLTRFRNDNLTLLEQKFNAIKAKHKSNRQSLCQTRYKEKVPVCYQLCH